MRTKDRRILRPRPLLILGAALIAAYLLVAYLLAPLFWREATGRKPAVAVSPW